MSLDHLLAKMELGWKAYIFSTSHVLKSNIELSTLNFTESLKSKIEFSSQYSVSSPGEILLHIILV